MEFPLFVNIAVAIGFLAMAVLCIYLLILLLQLRQTFKTVRIDVREVSENVLPVLENLKVITGKIRGIAENVDDQVSVVRDSVSKLHEMTENIVSFERNLQHQIEGPIMEAVSFVAAIIKGVKTFIGKIRENSEPTER